MFNVRILININLNNSKNDEITVFGAFNFGELPHHGPPYRGREAYAILLGINFPLRTTTRKLHDEGYFEVNQFFLNHKRSGSVSKCYGVVTVIGCST